MFIVYASVIVVVCMATHICKLAMYVLTLVLLNPDIPCLCKRCRSRSQLIWICTVCHSVCEFISAIWIKESDWLTIRNGYGILIYSAWQVLRTSFLSWCFSYMFFISILQINDKENRAGCFHVHNNVLTLSSLCFWIGRFHSWFWTSPLL